MSKIMRTTRYIKTYISSTGHYFISIWSSGPSATAPPLSSWAWNRPASGSRPRACPWPTSSWWRWSASAGMWWSCLASACASCMPSSSQWDWDQGNSPANPLLWRSSPSPPACPSQPCSCGRAHRPGETTLSYAAPWRAADGFQAPSCSEHGSWSCWEAESRGLPFPACH